MPSTVGSVIESVAEQFQRAGLFYGHGTESAWDEAVVLVLTVAQLDDDESILQETLPPGALARIAELAATRVQSRSPLPYLLGECHYAGLVFEVSPAVLVPRSPIGLWLLEQGDAYLRQAPATIVDLCCGCGCLGIVAALAYPDARLLLSDIDPDALAVARRNVVRHGLQERTWIVQADAVTAFAARRSFDLVLCNPPYVNATDMASLPAEYRREPQHALAAGVDGLSIIVPIIEQLPQLLSPGGLFVGEVGHSAAALGRRFADLPLTWLEAEAGAQGLFALSMT
ncbi:MAG: 50S ribosomal protein L3 N(5)-glutamine methyltransferase [Pseudomonadales bacterium]